MNLIDMLPILATLRGRKNVKMGQDQTCISSVMSRDTVPKLPTSHGAFPRKSCLPWHKIVQSDNDQPESCYIETNSI